LDNTPRQIYLQRVLELENPSYAHVPVLVEPDGVKLAKSARSVRLENRVALPQLLQAFELLGLAPPPGLKRATIAAAWTWAIGEWDINRVARRLTLPLKKPDLP
jgi:glutamyl-Q tRNA(Asp) synthetase